MKRNQFFVLSVAMNSRPKLSLAWCSPEAALFAVKRWHYSKSLPTPPLVKIGVWEDDIFIGVVLFGRGASPSLLKPYGLTQIEGCELVRVALNSHKASASKIISIAIKMLRKANPGLRLVVSYADRNQGHTGAIYQAGNWVYTGETAKSTQYIDRTGRVWHERQVSVSGVSTQYGSRRIVPRIKDCKRAELLPKHRYIYPLDEQMRTSINHLQRPYPKRQKDSSEPLGEPVKKGRGSTDPDAPNKIKAVA